MKLKEKIKYKSLLLVVCVCVATSFFLLTGCGNASTLNKSANSSSKIKVFAAENFYGEVAQAVGGNRVEVTSVLTNPNVDPHDYEPTVQTSELIQDAQMAIYNGAGYDEWMKKLIDSSSSNQSLSVIKVANDLMGKKEGDNEHVWYNPETMPKLANKIADDLANLDPKHAGEYHHRAQSYIASLDPIKEKVLKLKQNPAVKIDVSEPVFSYMADALNLQISDTKFSKDIDEGTDPTPSELAKLQNDIKNKKVKFFVYNIQNSSPTIENLVNLADSYNIPVVKVTETKPKGENYLEWMTNQLNSVEKALGNR